MTCTLSSPWHHFNDVSPWSPMNSDDIPTAYGLERQLSRDSASSGSESKRPSGSGKKRASRAGTRSVTTLSTAQLERKRANDREAQRAIRQRTKDHIDLLEKSISDLRGSQEATEKVAAAAQQRNRELEEENSFLRSRLAEAGYTLTLPLSDGHRPSDPSLLSVQSASPGSHVSASSMQHPASTSSPGSISSARSLSSDSRRGTFQPQGGYGQNAPSSAPGMPTVSNMGPNALVSSNPAMVNWRPSDGQSLPSMQQQGQAMYPAQSTSQQISGAHPGQALPQQVQDPTHGHRSYGAHEAPRINWQGAGSAYQYSMTQEHPQQAQPHHYEQSLPHPASGPLQQLQYAPQAQQSQQGSQYMQQAPIAHYQGTAAASQQSYRPSQMPPQSEFQALTVSTPPSYQVTQQPGYAPSVGYPMAPAQISPSTTDYAAMQNQMQTPTMSVTGYHQPHPEQEYSPQQVHPPMQLQYRDEANNPTYPMTHYNVG